MIGDEYRRLAESLACGRGSKMRRIVRGFEGARNSMYRRGTSERFVAPQRSGAAVNLARFECLVREKGTFAVPRTAKVQRRYRLLLSFVSSVKNEADSCAASGTQSTPSCTDHVPRALVVAP